LLLGGGTALGAVQVAIICHLISKYGPPIAIEGVSVGSANGAFVGQGRHGELEAVWLTVDGTRWFQRAHLDFWNGLFDLKPLREKIRSYQIHTGTFVIPTFAGAVDVGSGQYRSLPLGESPKDTEDGIIVSCTQPLIHRTSRYKGRVHADGGVRNIVPQGILPGIDTKGVQIHAVSCSPVSETARFKQYEQGDLDEPFGLLGAVFGILMGEAGLNDVSRLRDRARSEGPVTVWAPDAWDDVGRPFDASREAVRRRLRTGERIAASGGIVL
jgi:predicted acylesterase/phospholipase RssA